MTLQNSADDPGVAGKDIDVQAMMKKISQETVRPGPYSSRYPGHCGACCPCPHYPPWPAYPQYPWHFPQRYYPDWTYRPYYTFYTTSSTSPAVTIN